MLLGILITIAILTLIDWYAYQALRAVTRKLRPIPRRTLRFGWWGWSIVNAVLITVVFFGREQNVESMKLSYTLLGAVFASIVPKLIISTVLLLEDIYRLLRALVMRIKRSTQPKETPKPLFESRRRFLSATGLAIGSIPFGAIIHGMVKGQYKFTVHRVELSFPDLPAAFDGYTITQLSDIHSGGFDDYDAVRRGVEMANAENSDLFVITGDLVNNLSEEMDEWVDLFKQIEAPDGKLAVLGNHDYGHYVEWDSEEEGIANHQRVQQQYRNIGCDLMLNENRRISRNGESIVLAGVENWGLKPFPQIGDLDKAFNDVANNDFTVLLSHDPSHFSEKVVDHQKHVHLTLSGHTHGMQFGIEIPGWKWSPVKYKYPKWAGLYEEKGQYLYVNRGFGCIGFPGRVGIWPEITVITLKKEAVV